MRHAAERRAALLDHQQQADAVHSLRLVRGRVVARARPQHLRLEAVVRFAGQGDKLRRGEAARGREVDMDGQLLHVVAAHFYLADEPLVVESDGQELRHQTSRHPTRPGCRQAKRGRLEVRPMLWNAPHAAHAAAGQLVREVKVAGSAVGAHTRRAATVMDMLEQRVCWTLRIKGGAYHLRYFFARQLHLLPIRYVQTFGNRVQHVVRRGPPARTYWP
jgi:hypothetical protein